MKKLNLLCTFMLLAFSISQLHAQSKDIIAKSAMLNADESYGNGKYSDCISFLKEAESNLGKTNSRIQYLHVKSLMLLGSSDPYNGTLWKQADSALNKFFLVTPENGYVPEKYEEMVLAVSKIKKFMADTVNGIVKRRRDLQSSIIEKDPTNYFAYCKRGNLKSYLEDYQGALLDYNKAVEIKPDCGRCYESRAILKQTHLNDLNGSLQDYNKCLEILPNSSVWYGHRSEVKYELKDFQGALADIKKTLELDPNSSDAYECRARVKYELKDFQGALDDIKKALEIEPDWPPSRLFRTTIEAQLNGH